MVIDLRGKMSDIETRLGLTNVLKRLAYSFLCEGFGRRKIDHNLYDEVEVSELYPWKANPECTDEHGAGIKVTFFRDGKRIRWVEFGVRFAGGGGDESIFRIK